ncbi:cryptochrome DASH [Pleomassaria siparia CBS 279.74]|uniref:Cryptochrome DASH n=1 Tax=Pleomassaria siparia CBS 279.74 TaxID=1314801 RepID=A0A6G1K7I7_9PLEO|nr:cryptochrome DASH [Pleomassaria siparia CBS 279.74]
MHQFKQASRVKPRILIYILRRDVRLSDNPIFHRASLSAKPGSQTDSTLRHRSCKGEDLPTSEHESLDFTHLLPVYIFPANQVEVSGFLPSSVVRSPYVEARSRVAGLWRTGPHRARFTAEGVWGLKERLEGLGCGSGLEVRVGLIGDVVQHMLSWYAERSGEDEDNRADVAGIWMSNEDGTEEKRDEAEVKNISEQNGVAFKVWDDVKYYIDDRDLPFHHISDLPNIYTAFRKSVEPLRSRPRQTLSAPTTLPPLPPDIPPQKTPFEIPSSLEGLQKSLHAPFEKDPTFGLQSPPRMPPDTQNAYPFGGGEKAGQDRLTHLVSSGAMSSYKSTRNGMVGLDFSTKLSAYLAQGHVTARQIHWAMMDFEDGKGVGQQVCDYGKGENDGTKAVRFELLWRDYMRLCSRKFGARMFHINGIRDRPKPRPGQNDDAAEELHNQEGQPSRKKWRYINGTGEGSTKTREVFARFRAGQTGMGLIDASNRELSLTGYTSNRARQNVASFLASHLEIDWRVGAEWYEFLLIDHEVANNWGNWQYVAGVGNDPRQGRVFNPVKQAFDYDKQGEYIKAWVPELRGVTLTKSVGGKKEEIDQQKLMGLYQAWRLGDWEKNRLELKGLEWVEKPLVKIQFSVGRGRGAEPDGDGRGRGKGKGRGMWRGGSRGRGFRRMGTQDRAGRWQSSGGDGEQ